MTSALSVSTPTFSACCVSTGPHNGTTLRTFRVFHSRAGSLWGWRQHNRSKCSSLMVCPPWIRSQKESPALRAGPVGGLACRAKACRSFAIGARTLACGTSATSSPAKRAASLRADNRVCSSVWSVTSGTNSLAYCNLTATPIIDRAGVSANFWFTSLTSAAHLSWASMSPAERMAGKPGHRARRNRLPDWLQPRGDRHYHDRRHRTSKPMATAATALQGADLTSGLKFSTMRSRRMHNRKIPSSADAG